MQSAHTCTDCSASARLILFRQWYELLSPERALVLLIADSFSVAAQHTSLYTQRRRYKRENLSDVLLRPCLAHDRAHCKHVACS